MVGEAMVRIYDTMLDFQNITLTNTDISKVPYWIGQTCLIEIQNKQVSFCDVIRW